MLKSLHRLATLAGLATALIAPAGAHAADIGLNLPGGGAALNLVSTASSVGGGTQRVFVTWDGSAQPSAQTIADYRAIVSRLNGSGLKPMFVVTGTSAPGNVNAYASYVGALAKAYGGDVAAWEIWNEPDEAIWWGQAGGDPALYASLLKATYPLVHPYAPVFVGGLTGNNYVFLQGVYSALGGNSAGAFDGVATHTDTACSIVPPSSFYRNPDGRISQFSFLGLREVHAVMQRYGDGTKPLWITELGWSTSTAVCDGGMWKGQKAGGVSEDDQAKFLAMAWHCLKDYPYVQNALWFNLADHGGDEPANRFGLLRPDGSAKPALAVYKSVLAGNDPYAGQPCGDFDAPTITVSAPLEGGRFTGQLPISVSATDLNGIGRITLLADGKKIRNFTTGLKDPAQYPKTLPGTIVWQGGKKLALGRHTITVQALDGNGNLATKDVHVVKKAKKRARRR